MSDHREAKPKTNTLLRALNHKFFLQCILLLLFINSSASSDSPVVTFQCAKSCECNQTINSARCEDVNELIASYKDDDRLHVLMSIKSLDLSNNQLEKVSHQLEILEDIEELNLSHNRLTQVQKLNFKNLQKLNLSHNRITSAKLKKLPKTVVELNLASNEITYLPTEFMKFKKLRRLEMTGNPLNCTCDTLHVRNWLSTNHVWTDKIICSLPMNVKGQPWLQVRQNDICYEGSSTTTVASTTFKSKYTWEEYEDNEIMGDQPQEDENAETKDGIDDYEEDAEEETSEAPNDDDEKDVFDEKKEEKSETKDEEEEEKSTDEDNFIPVPPETDHESSSEDSLRDVHDSEGSGDETTSSPEPLPADDDDGSGDESSGEDVINPMNIFVNESTTIAPLNARVQLDPNAYPTNPDPPQGSVDKTERASTQDNLGTYVLLAILGICLVALMFFVMMKNKKEKNRNRRYDVEKNGGTELQDMDKQLLGKPVEKNGSNGNGKAEHIPLMNGNGNNNSSPDNKPYFDAPEITIEEPKSHDDDHQPRLNGNGKPAESVHEIPAKVNLESVDSPSKPLSSDSEDDAFHPANNESLNVSPEPPKRYSPVYASRSPPNERYSPVYSPETGRVKIKLTETPKPKTPVVVSRSRSGERDYINTIN